jgi:predicted transcriptional regulator of viral defense system
MEMKKNISFLEFRDFFMPLGCFSIHQVRIWHDQFDRNNLHRWVKEGKLIKLRQGFYSFPALLSQGDAVFHVANKLYVPSYISLESALSFHGMIPERVVQTTSISSLKTKSFSNAFGTFVYRSVKPSLMFGYTREASTFAKDWYVMIATAEKALLDFLYLNPRYATEKDFLDVRLDVDFMHDELDVSRLDAFLERFESKSLERRVHLLKGVYL